MKTVNRIARSFKEPYRSHLKEWRVNSVIRRWHKDVWGEEEAELRSCRLFIPDCMFRCANFGCAFNVRDYFSGNRNSSTGALNNVGTNGYYWSSAVNGTNGSNLNFNSSNVNPANNNNRANGFAVRCVQAFTTCLFNM